MMTLRFEKTCNFAPEQYDVFRGDEIVGYVRLRWGLFTVTCPDVGGDLVYQAKVGKSFTGCFENEAQENYHLENTKIAIKKWLDNRNA